MSSPPYVSPESTPPQSSLPSKPTNGLRSSHTTSPRQSPRQSRSPTDMLDKVTYGSTIHSSMSPTDNHLQQPQVELPPRFTALRPPLAKATPSTPLVIHQQQIGTSIRGSESSPKRLDSANSTTRFTVPSPLTPFQVPAALRATSADVRKAVELKLQPRAVVKLCEQYMIGSAPCVQENDCNVDESLAMQNKEYAAAINRREFSSLPPCRPPRPLQSAQFVRPAAAAKERFSENTASTKKAVQNRPATADRPVKLSVPTFREMRTDTGLMLATSSSGNHSVDGFSSEAEGVSKHHEQTPSQGSPAASPTLAASYGTLVVTTGSSSTKEEELLFSSHSIDELIRTHIASIDATSRNASSLSPSGADIQVADSTESIFSSLKLSKAVHDEFVRETLDAMAMEFYAVKLPRVHAEIANIINSQVGSSVKELEEKIETSRRIRTERDCQMLRSQESRRHPTPTMKRPLGDDGTMNDVDVKDSTSPSTHAEMPTKRMSGLSLVIPPIDKGDDHSKADTPTQKPLSRQSSATPRGSGAVNRPNSGRTATLPAVAVAKEALEDITQQEIQGWETKAMEQDSRQATPSHKMMVAPSQFGLMKHARHSKQPDQEEGQETDGGALPLTQTQLSDSDGAVQPLPFDMQEEKRLGDGLASSTSMPSSGLPDVFSAGGRLEAISRDTSPSGLAAQPVGNASKLSAALYTARLEIIKIKKDIADLVASRKARTDSALAIGSGVQRSNSSNTAIGSRPLLSSGELNDSSKFLSDFLSDTAMSSSVANNNPNASSGKVKIDSTTPTSPKSGKARASVDGASPHGSATGTISGPPLFSPQPPSSGTTAESVMKRQASFMQALRPGGNIEKYQRLVRFRQQSTYFLRKKLKNLLEKKRPGRLANMLNVEKDREILGFGVRTDGGEDSSAMQSDAPAEIPIAPPQAHNSPTRSQAPTVAIVNPELQALNEVAEIQAQAQRSVVQPLLDALEPFEIPPEIKANKEKNDRLFLEFQEMIQQTRTSQRQYQALHKGSVEDKKKVLRELGVAIPGDELEPSMLRRGSSSLPIGSFRTNSARRSMSKVKKGMSITRRKSDVGTPKKLQTIFSDLGLQATIEDEQILYTYLRLECLVMKEQSYERMWGTMHVALRNIVKMWEEAEVDLSCVRCQSLAQDAMIIAPCGITVCRDCLQDEDEHTFDMHVREECHCTNHDGSIPNILLRKLIKAYAIKDVTGAITPVPSEVLLMDLQYQLKVVANQLGLSLVDAPELRSRAATSPQRKKKKRKTNDTAGSDSDKEAATSPGRKQSGDATSSGGSGILVNSGRHNSEVDLKEKKQTNPPGMTRRRSVVIKLNDEEGAGTTDASSKNATAISSPTRAAVGFRRTSFSTDDDDEDEDEQIQEDSESVEQLKSSRILRLIRQAGLAEFEYLFAAAHIQFCRRKIAHRFESQFRR